ncbi:MAG: 4-(cytidine 5'-diphospho)-2-C-methyl-D-erythritol kinase [Salinibacter sp.]
MRLRERAPAKINLGLHVLRKRPDGYHDVETVLHRIDWADTITAEPADTLSMTCSDPALPTDEANLCMQAARALAEASGVTSGAALHLNKQVPYGAGLGGGSSDAAATLRLLARLWELNPSPDALHDIARQIGADVPFFLGEAPAAYATGRGDNLTPLRHEGRPYRLPYSILVVVPPVEVATPEAYAHVTPDEAERPHLPSLLRTNDLAQWRSSLVNDFESPIATAHSEVAAARDWLRGEGADYVSLSGSGGAVYALFENSSRAQAVRARGNDRPERMHLAWSPDDRARAPMGS